MITREIISYLNKDMKNKDSEIYCFANILTEQDIQYLKRWGYDVTCTTVKQSHFLIDGTYTRDAYILTKRKEF